LIKDNPLFFGTEEVSLSTLKLPGSSLKVFYHLNVVLYLVVEKVNDSGGPLSAGDDGGIGAEEAQQAQSCRLLDHVQRVAENRQRGQR